MNGLLLLMLLAPAAPDIHVDSAKPESEKLVCKQEPVIGSRVKKTKMCFTEAEWERIRRDTHQTKGEFERRSAQGAFPGN